MKENLHISPGDFAVVCELLMIDSSGCSTCSCTQGTRSYFKTHCTIIVHIVETSIVDRLLTWALKSAHPTVRSDIRGKRSKSWFKKNETLISQDAPHQHHFRDCWFARNLHFCTGITFHCKIPWTTWIVVWLIACQPWFDLWRCHQNHN